MKKSTAVILVLVMCCMAVSAMAAGKLSVTQENFHVIDSYSVYGYAYAKVENVGDKPIKVNAGLLEIYDENGDPITSDDYIDAHAQYLDPGQYTYVSVSETIDVESSLVDDYMLTVSGKSDKETAMIQFPCDTDYAQDTSNQYYVRNYMYATFTNTTDKALYGIEIVMALLDADGNILYIDSDDMYDSKALNPGSSMTVRLDVGSDFLDYFDANGYVPTTVDAIAYVEVPRE